MLASLKAASPFVLFGFSFLYIFARGLVFCSILFGCHRKWRNRREIVSMAQDSIQNKKQFRSELKANLRVNVLDAIALPSVVLSGVVHDHAFTWLRFFAGFLFCYLFFETWFYGMHRLLHTRHFRKFHGQHHGSRRTSALSALSLSLPEKALNLTGMYVVPCLLTNLFPILFPAIMTYHFYNFLVNVLGHSNLEILPKGYEKTRLGKIFVTSTYHSLHHLKGNHNFGLFLTVLDKLFGTYNVHYPETYRRVTSAEPVRI